eukprot:TRINITY_DN15716_c0_g1_i2.p1 TRINITY_DN15716_c0_g1~~TRINITY_DN15716_c0_g1_i2.p1  ORF type:complete len:198 (-),score=28.92 TRINITY_DN15716_c0_g1_i2:287-880(-)
MEESRAPSIKVIVMNLAGKELHIEVDHGSTAKSVKAAIADSWSLPLAFQKLLIEAEVVDGEVVVSDLAEDSGIPDGEPLRMLCVYSLPYDGDINKAAAAGDREAIRALMQERDKDRAVPAVITLIVNPKLRTVLGWPRISEALIERGYTREEVDAAIAMMPERYSYNNVLEHLESALRVISDSDVPSLKWWRTPPGA